MLRRLPWRCCIERRPRVRAAPPAQPKPAQPPPTAGSGAASAAAAGTAARAVPAGREGRVRQSAGRRPELGRRQGRGHARATRSRRRSRPKTRTRRRRCRTISRSCRPSGSVMSDAARAQLEKDIERQHDRGRALRAGRAGRDQRAAAGSCRTSSRRSCCPMLEQIAKEKGLQHRCSARRSRGHRWAKPGIDLTLEVVKKLDAAAEAGRRRPSRSGTAPWLMANG